MIIKPAELKPLWFDGYMSHTIEDMKSNNNQPKMVKNTSKNDFLARSPDERGYQRFEILNDPFDFL